MNPPVYHCHFLLFYLLEREVEQRGLIGLFKGLQAVVWNEALLFYHASASLRSSNTFLRTRLSSERTALALMFRIAAISASPIHS